MLKGCIDQYRHLTLPTRLLDKEDANLYPLIKDNLVEGPSIVYHRYHERGVTKIVPQEYGDRARSYKVLGVDVNALYLWYMLQEMPTGSPHRYKPIDGVYLAEGRHRGKVAHTWLEWMSRSCGINIRHRGEVKLGNHDCPVDSFSDETRTILQLYGWYWHGLECDKTSGTTDYPTRYIPMVDLLADTHVKEHYLRELGYTVITVWECEWEREVNSRPNIKVFFGIFFQSLYPHREPAESPQIIDRILSGNFFWTHKV